MDEVLKVRNLVVRFYTYAGVVKALEGIDFEVREKETFGLVGETGCGKSVTALSMLGLTPSPGEIESGEVLFKRNDGFENVTKLSESELRKIRGNEISMVFQEPNDALNPVYTIGDQIAEAFMAHQLEYLIDEVKRGIEKDMRNSNFLKRKILETELKLYNKMVDDPDSSLISGLSKIPLLSRYRKRLDEAARRSVVQMLESVGIPDPEDVVNKYPFEMSGGMNQRAVISLALACRPRLLIADEPTSNLDVSIQARILDILNDMKDEYGLSILYITHDLGVVAQTCERAGVMYAGRLVEVAEIEELFENPTHPYTKMLLRAVPSRDKDNLETIGGAVPDLISPPPGCRFHPRCPWATDICSEKVPDLEKVGENHSVACHHWRDMDERSS